MTMSMAWKNSPISFASGAPPEKPNREPVAKREQGRHRRPRLPQSAHLVADPQGPLAEPSLRSVRLLQPLQYGAVDLLVDARHAREDSGADLRECDRRAERI